jgi:hypothetical protein
VKSNDALPVIPATSKRQHLRSVELEAFATRKPAQTINHRRPQKPAETLC